MSELWKPIKGLEGYEVSSLGNVRSIDRVVLQAARGGGYFERPCKGRILKVPLYDGRPTVQIVKRHYRVSRLVAAAFIGSPPDGMVVCHNDGNPQNNAVSNLRYDTPQGNEADKIIHGTYQYGSKNSQAKLTEAAVLHIRELRKTKKVAEIANIFGVTQATVCLVVSGKRWAHV